jgi:hypothetical protein
VPCSFRTQAVEPAVVAAEVGAPDPADPPPDPQAAAANARARPI